MNCKDCLKALQTESLREMSPDSPVMRHCATCPDCARVTTMLRDKEYETATVLNNLPPMSNPLTVAGAAVQTAQRRRVGRVVVMLSGMAGAIIIWIVAATMIVLPMQRAGIIGGNDGEPPKSAVRTETMTLSCLSPQQAGDIITPYIRSEKSRISIPGSGISAITVTGTADELAKSRSLVLEFEENPSAACRLPMAIAKRLQDEMAKGTDGMGTGAYLAPGKASTSLLGQQHGKSLLDPKTPLGSGPVPVPDKATTPPTKD